MSRSCSHTLIHVYILFVLLLIYLALTPFVWFFFNNYYVHFLSPVLTCFVLTSCHCSLQLFAAIFLIISPATLQPPVTFWLQYYMHFSDSCYSKSSLVLYCYSDTSWILLSLAPFLGLECKISSHLAYLLYPTE